MANKNIFTNEAVDILKKFTNINQSVVLEKVNGFFMVKQKTNDSSVGYIITFPSDMVNLELDVVAFLDFRNFAKKVATFNEQPDYHFKMNSIDISVGKRKFVQRLAQESIIKNKIKNADAIISKMNESIAKFSSAWLIENMAGLQVKAIYFSANEGDKEIKITFEENESEHLEDYIPLDEPIKGTLNCKIYADGLSLLPKEEYEVLVIQDVGFIFHKKFNDKAEAVVLLQQAGDE